MTQELAQVGAAAGTSAAEKSVGEPGSVVFPASFGQQRLWFLSRLEPESTAYAMPLLAKLSGPLDRAALTRALSGLIERHEILRTTFSERDGDVIQHVLPAAPVQLDVVDVSERSDPETAGRELALRTLGQPFDLASGPLFRSVLVALEENEHLLVLALHHVVADGWSIGVLKRDLGELYAAEVEKRPPDLPDLAIQYGDYAAWQREWLQGPRLEEQLEYWRGELDGAPPLLELPTDKPRPATQGFRGAHRRRVLDRALADRLRTLAREEDASLFMILLAGFGALLARHSGQEDVVIGTPTAGRDRVELEPLIGFFGNTLPLRIALGEDPTFSELVARVREVTLAGYEHQALPFEKLVAELNPERRLSHSPLFQVLFALQPATGRLLELPGLRATTQEVERGTSKWDLALFALETSDGIRLSCEYSTDIFEAETIDRMLGRLEVLLAAVAGDPALRVGAIPIVPPAERERLTEWSTGAGDEPAPDRCAHQLVQDQAARTPDSPALVFRGEPTTYAELLDSATRVAVRLQEMGVRPGVTVAICAERSPALVAGVLGILMAGAAYAPLDPTYPPERLRLMLDDLDSPVLLADAELFDALPATDARMVDLHEAASSGPGRSKALPPGSLEDLAYVLFTSGSTGRPKGVAMPHGPLANLLAWQLESWTEPAPARTLQFASLNFDVSFQEIFCTLAAGGTLILPDEDTRRDPSALLALMSEQSVERLFLPFVALANLAETSMLTGLVPKALREVITAGEALQITPAIRFLFGELDGAVLQNQYGPTESHVVSQYTLDGAPEEWPSRPSIGRPIANVELYVLDRPGQLAPIGVPGEIHIGGLALARGYLGRPELTAERFVVHPFDADPAARLYRTGDLGRYLSDGTIEFLGRADDQLKVRGVRVEPGEIEATLREHPAVRDALVIASEHQGDQRLAAYVVADSHAPGAQELEALLRRTLPEYMIPSVFVPVDEFPLTPSGKLDRRALPAPEARRTSEAGREPRDDLERELTAIWAEVLGIRGQVGIHDDFFELGGHSLLATRLFTEIGRRIGVQLPLSMVFRGATVAELASAIRAERMSSRPWSTIVALRATGSRPPLFVLSLGDGDVLQYRELVAQLGSDQPVYGLRAPGLDGRTLPLGRIEDLAAHYIREVRAFQPGRPLLLLGYCFAGVVAYEMARQLFEAGEEPAMLAMIDSVPYGHSWPRPSRLQRERQRMIEFARSNREERRAWISRRARNAHYKVGLAAYDVLARTGRPPPRRTPWQMNVIASSGAVRRYVTPTSQARILYFASRASAEASDAARWIPLAAGGIDFLPVTGPDVDHYSIMRQPYAGVVAEALEGAIDERLAKKGQA